MHKSATITTNRDGISSIEKGCCRTCEFQPPKIRQVCTLLAATMARSASAARARSCATSEAAAAR